MTTPSKTIEIIVDPRGRTRVETKGFAGSGCREASRFVEQALGQRTGEQVTAEFYETPQVESLRQSHG
jgi:hypothetical protein